MSAASAFATFEHATTALQPGDTLCVAAGVYTDTGDNPFKIANVSGAGDAWIRVVNCPSTAVVTIVDTRRWGVGVEISNAHWVVLQGFQITAPTTDGDGIDIDNRSTHIEIVGNYVYGAGGGGISSLPGSDYLNVSYNRVYGCAHTSTSANSGISLYQLANADTAAGYHNYVTNNIVLGNYQGVVATGAKTITDGNGIIIDDTHNNQHRRYAVYTGSTLVENNIVYGNGGAGIEVFDSDNVDVEFNTAYWNGYQTLIPTPVGDLHSCCSNKNIRFLHNVAIAHAGTYAEVSSHDVNRVEDDERLWSDNGRYTYNGAQGTANTLALGGHTVIEDPGLRGPLPSVNSASWAEAAFRPTIADRIAAYVADPGGDTPTEDISHWPRPPDTISIGALQIAP